MNEIPQLLVNTGLTVDNNGGLTEMTVPDNVTTLQGPTSVITYASTVNWIPSNAANLTTFSAPNASTMSSNAFQNYTALTSISLPNMLSLSETSDNGFLKGCTSLRDVDFPKVASLRSQQKGGTFNGCTSLKSITLPSVTAISTSASSGGGALYGGTFYSCSSLEEVFLPKVRTLSSSSGTYGYSAVFYSCPALKKVVLGSPGHPVTSLGSTVFRSTTQDSLTITLYTTNGASLANSPWGATNATIVYEEA